MSRERPEWIGATDDAPIPRLVKLRIWEREGGRCYLSNRKIQPGDAYEFEHVIALECGGQHRESNIRLALSEPHKAKTAEDHDTGAKIKRIHAKHNGYWPKSKTPLKSRGFEPSRKKASQTRPDGDREARRAKHASDLNKYSSSAAEDNS